MSEANTPSPLGIDLNTAQNAIRAMIAPEEDTATTTEALEADEAEMPEDDASCFLRIIPGRCPVRQSKIPCLCMSHRVFFL